TVSSTARGVTTDAAWRSSIARLWVSCGMLAPACDAETQSNRGLARVEGLPDERERRVPPVRGDRESQRQVLQHVREPTSARRCACAARPTRRAAGPGCAAP